MTNEKNQTIAYYDDPANAYADQTFHADMSTIYELFMELKKTLTMPKGTFPMRANLPSWEGNMAKEWDEMNLYQLLLDSHDAKKPFYLHDGPPYANGEIHAFF